MAKKRLSSRKKEAVQDGRLVPIEYETGTPSVFANNFVIQSDGPEIHLSFFELVPPIAIGTHDEVQGKLGQIQSVHARCVARIVVSKERLPSWLAAMQDHLEKQTD